ncbi:MAG: T9SS C-terminal target domain-containing protein [Bacteroidetes bacterium]|nr:T9SS C-terminal target domain-containing protein [Bacteroidota bacterium]
MKNILIIFLLCMSRVYGQAPAIEWQNTIGGYDYEYFWALQQTSEGGYILGGQSVSDISGDKSEACLGSNDFWIVKLDTAGIIQWQNTIGGDHSDILYSLQQTIDEGYISCGYSESEISGDKTESTIGILGLQDYWVVKLDSIGNIEWQNTIGGDTYDNARVVRQTGDGGYIVGGNSSSPISGDKSDSCIGGSDWWILKLNDIGEIQWQKTIGGDLDDVFCTMEHTVDGGYIVGGYSQSNISGNKTENSVGSSDMWVVKMDSLGNIGGKIQLVEVIGMNYGPQNKLLMGDTYLGTVILDISGDKTESCIGGFPDYWVVKIDSVGNIEWQNTRGGLYYDYGFSIHQTVDGGYIFGGQSASSISGDKTEDSYGNFDYWVLKLSSIGGIDWQATLGGTLVEALTEVRPTFDGGYILGGLSQSGITGIKTEPCIGQYDYWIIKLFPD